MALKLIPLDEERSTQADPNVSTRSLFALGRGIESPARFLGSLAPTAAIKELFPKLEGEAELPTDVLARRMGYNQEGLSPRSLPESFVHKLAEVAPMTLGGSALLGGAKSLLPSLARSAVGAGAGTGLKALGMPEIVQDIGQLVGELGTAGYQGRIPTAASKVTKFENLARSAVKETERHGMKHLSSEIGRIKDLPKGPDAEKALSGALDALDKYVFRFSEGPSLEKFYNPNRLRDGRKIVDEIMRKSDSSSRPFLMQLRTAINDQFEKNAMENKGFFDALRNNADKLSVVNKMKGPVEDMLNYFEKTTAGKRVLGDLESSGPFSKAAQTALGVGKGALTLVGRLADVLAGPPYRLVKTLSKKDPTLWNHWQDLFKASTSQDAGAFLKAGESFAKALNIPTSKGKEEEPKRLKLIPLD